MSDIYTQTLARAVEAQGTTQALASLLHVPEGTLLRWMSGRAKMPLRAFLALISVLAQYEKTGGGYPRSENNRTDQNLVFRMGQLLARCGRCDGTEFVAANPAQPVKLTSELVCCACGHEVIHGNLIAELAKDAVHQSRASSAAVKKRQARVRETNTKLRGVKTAAENRLPPKSTPPEESTDNCEQLLRFEPGAARHLRPLVIFGSHKARAFLGRIDARLDADLGECRRNCRVLQRCVDFCV